MASNEMPGNIDQLFTLAEDAADGLHAHEAAVGVKQNTEASVRGDLAAARDGTGEYDASRTARALRVAEQTAADNAAKACLSAARKVLTLRLGDGWSDAWLLTGFPNQSTAVPGNIQGRQEVLFALNRYFGIYPTQEVAALNVTAAQTLILANALSDARSAVNDATADCGAKKSQRDAAVAQLRKRLRGLVSELGQLLADDDPRWNAFGLNLPAAPNTPEVPDAPALAVGTAGTVLADWPDAPRADYYRVFKQVVGVDAEFVFVNRASDSDLTLTGLPSGSTVKICVTAVNAAGETSKSESAQIVVP